MKTPQGFKLSAIAAGIKKEGLDLGLISSDVSAVAAAVFTRNAFPAAPVLFSRENLRRTDNRVRAILVNSGNANAATGEEGMAAARMCAEKVALLIGSSFDEVFISSTGVIGRPLPVARICAAVPHLTATLSAGATEQFARSIMTTDTFPKIASARVGDASILGFAKGAGMIHPDMATMLSFILTDAKVDSVSLNAALRHAVDQSFHCISVDGDTSTNDVVLVLANGAANFAPPSEQFREGLDHVCQELAKSIVRDGKALRSSSN